MKIEDFVTRLQGVKDTPNGISARCPGHDDRHPSFVVTETDDRILIHCRAGCGTGDILAAMGLGYADLFLGHAKIKSTTSRNRLRQPDPVPAFHWDWRRQCAELERHIQAKREHAEAMLGAMHGLGVDALTPTEFDEVMDLVARAHDWLARCERLDETLFLVQQALRADEQTDEAKKKGEGWQHDNDDDGRCATGGRKERVCARGHRTTRA